MSQCYAKPLTHAWHINGSPLGRQLAPQQITTSNYTNLENHCLQCIQSTSSKDSRPGTLESHDFDSQVDILPSVSGWHHGRLVNRLHMDFRTWTWQVELNLWISVEGIRPDTHEWLGPDLLLQACRTVYPVDILAKVVYRVHWFYGTKTHFRFHLFSWVPCVSGRHPSRVVDRVHEIQISRFLELFQSNPISIKTNSNHLQPSLNHPQSPELLQSSQIHHQLGHWSSKW